jgi:hypothetical protein
MKIVGCDLHARQQSIAMVDTETGEFTERPLPGNSEQYESFMLAWNRNLESGKWQEVLLPDEIPDAHSDAWKSLEAYIEKVDAEGRDELNPIGRYRTRKMGTDRHSSALYQKVLIC